jgi:DNA-directed RNA polymerase subunit M/transcription elongation factor TFIIS
LGVRPKRALVFHSARSGIGDFLLLLANHCTLCDSRSIIHIESKTQSRVGCDRRFDQLEEESRSGHLDYFRAFSKTSWTSGQGCDRVKENVMAKIAKTADRKKVMDTTKSTDCPKCGKPTRIVKRVKDRERGVPGGIFISCSVCEFYEKL